MKAEMLQQHSAGTSKAVATVFALLLSVIFGTAHADTLYVDGNAGDDQAGGNNCTNEASPCATIQHAIGSAQAGDAVQIADSVYTEMLTIDKALSMGGQSQNGTIIQAAAERLQASERVISERRS